jgi:hypothetical protein
MRNETLTLRRFPVSVADAYRRLARDKGIDLNTVLKAALIIYADEHHLAPAAPPRFRLVAPREL